MSPSDKALWDAWVKEYLRDYDSYRCTIRLGYDPEEAIDLAKTFWDTPYIQSAIAEVNENRSKRWHMNAQRNENNLPEDFEPMDEDTERQRIVSALMREAYYRGPGSTHSARVAALSKLSNIFRLEEVAKSETDGRTVMVVPMRGHTLDEWESVASPQQSQLKQDVKR